MHNGKDSRLQPKLLRQRVTTHFEGGGGGGHRNWLRASVCSWRQMAHPRLFQRVRLRSIYRFTGGAACLARCAICLRLPAAGPR